MARRSKMLLVLEPAPVPVLKPDSRLNWAFSPPPRSSLPRRPKREVFSTPEENWVSEAVAVPFLAAALSERTPASSRPYRARLELSAWAAALRAPRAARVIRVFCMLSFGLEWRERV